MAGLTLQNANTLLIKYEPMIVQTLAEGAMTHQMFTTRDFKGDYVEVPLHIRRNPAHGGNTAGGAYRDAGHQSHLKGAIYRSFYDNAISLDDAIQAAAQGEGAVRDALDQEVSGVAEDAAFWLNSIAYGDGSGAVAVLGEAFGATATDRADLEATGGELILPQLATWEGAKFDVYDTTGATLRGQVTLDKVGTLAATGVGAASGGNIVFNCASGEGALLTADAATDILYWVGTNGTTKDQTFQGFNSLVDDIDATFQNIDIGEYTRYTSYVDAGGGTPRALSATLVRNAMSGMRQKTGVAPGNYVMCINPTAFAELDDAIGSGAGDPLNYYVSDTTLGAAIDKVQTNQGAVSFKLDNACPDNQAFGLDPSQLVRYVQKELGFVRRGGDILFNSTTAKQAVAQMTGIWEHAIMDRRKCFRIDDLTFTNYRNTSFA
jgi:hypothetical protein